MSMLAVPGIAAHRPLAIGDAMLTVAHEFAASAEALTAWAMHAGPDQVCVYARARMLPRGGVGARARELAAQGLVTLLPQMRPQPGIQMFDYRARRTALRFAEARPAPSGMRLTPEAQMLLDLLARYADEGAACPGNEALAARLGIKSGQAVSRLLTQLHRTNHVRVHAVTAIPERQIEILETGAMTGLLA